MPPVDLRGLYAVTPERADGARLLAEVDAALQGGCRILQFRDKINPMPERVTRARALRELTLRHGARLLINDDIALCMLIGADGVHLGADDGNLALARAILGPHRLLGASCYADLSKARAADALGVDYLAFGALYPSATKPDAARATVDLIFQAKTTLTAKICAIGGITVDNAAPVIAAGADLLAVITDLFDAPDIATRATQYQRLFA